MATLAKHGTGFEAAVLFDMETAIVFTDARQDYGEERRQALGFIGERLHVMVFTERSARFRVISLRKANRREVKVYDRYG